MMFKENGSADKREQTEPELTVVPDYIFHGTEEYGQPLEDAFRDWSLGVWDEAQGMEGTFDRVDMIEAYPMILNVHQSMRDYCEKELSLDVLDRMAPPQRAIIFHKGQYDEMRKLGNKSDSVVGTTLFDANIFHFEADGDPKRDSLVAQHEFIHTLQHREIRLTLEPDDSSWNFDIERVAVEVDDQGIAFTEMITQSMTCDIAERYWAQNDLEFDPDIAEEYYSGMERAFRGHLVPAIAEQCNQTPEDIEHGAYRDSITGSFEIHQKLQRTFGDEGLQAIMEMSIDPESDNSVEKTMHRLGFADFRM